MIDVGTAIGYLDLDTSKFTSGFHSAMEDLKTFQSESTTVSDKLAAVGSGLESAGRSLTTAVTLPIVGAGTAFVKTASDFDSAMATVQAISGATGDDFEKLSKKAQEMGAKTKFSASESAEAFKYMAMAGWKTEAMLDGIEGIMNLAAASGEDLGLTSDIVTDALTAFGLQAKDSAHFSDVLASAANNSNTNVSMLGESFKYVAPVAGSLKYSIEDTAVALGIMANSGIKASQAGTSLRSIFTNLLKPTDQMQTVMDQLGISVTEEDGSMKTLHQTMVDLRTAFSTLEDSEKATAAATLAGKYGMSGLLAIVNTSDEDFNKLTNAINNADGTAQRMSDTMLNNLGGQLVILKSTIEGIAISFGEILMPAMRKVTEKLQNLANWINGLSAEEKEQIVKIAGIVAAIGPLLLVGGKLITGISKVIKIIGLLKPALVAVKAAIAGISAPVLALVAVIGVLVGAFVHLWKTNDEFRDNIINTWNKIKETFQGFADGIVERINKLGFDFENIGQVISAIWDGLCNFLAPAFEAAFTQVSNIIQFVLDEVMAILDFFVALFTGDWEGLWEATKNIFKGAWDFIVNTFTNIINRIKNTANVVLGWFGTSWEECWTAIKTFFVNTWNGILEFFQSLPKKIQEFFQGVLDFFNELPEKIGEALGYVIGKIARWVVDTWEAAKELGPQVIDKIVEFFKELPGKIKEFIDKIVEFFKELPGKIGEQLTKAKEKVIGWKADILNFIKQKFPEIIRKITNFFKELPGKLKTIGKDLVKGLWNGINGAASWLKDKISGFANGIISGFKKAFGIASPSKKMKEQGIYLMEGLEEGMDDAVRGVIDKAKNIAGQLTYAFRQAYDLNRDISFEDTFFPENDPSSSRPRSSALSPYSRNITNNYVFNSPVAVTPTVAAKQMKQTAQQLALT